MDRMSITAGRGTGAGGLSCNDGVLNISNCRFFDNRTSGNGGGILITTGSASIQNSIFYNNAAFAGFAIWAQANVVALTNCTIADNAYIYHPYTNANGNTIFNNTNSFLIQNSIFGIIPTLLPASSTIRYISASLISREGLAVPAISIQTRFLQPSTDYRQPAPVSMPEILKPIQPAMRYSRASWTWQPRTA
ncbi:right-handed parallel beta-helix repeat-containing protein [Niabella defluvii]|nr:right-handed parallel beta-helix repeat-containing protein [Niabella sp. I65]